MLSLGIRPHIWSIQRRSTSHSLRTIFNKISSLTITLVKMLKGYDERLIYLFIYHSLPFFYFFVWHKVTNMEPLVGDRIRCNWSARPVIEIMYWKKRLIWKLFTVFEFFFEGACPCLRLSICSHGSSSDNICNHSNSNCDGRKAEQRENDSLAEFI